MTTDPEKQIALEQWMQTASPEGEQMNSHATCTVVELLSILTEQHTVLKMFKSAEEAQVKEVRFERIKSRSKINNGA